MRQEFIFITRGSQKLQYSIPTHSQVYSSVLSDRFGQNLLGLDFWGTEFSENPEKSRKISQVIYYRKSRFWFFDFRDFSKNIFCFVQNHIEKIKIFKIKNYFFYLWIWTRYVSNLQVPTTSGARWGKVNVSENHEKSRFSGKLSSSILKMVNKGVDTCKS